MLLKTYLGTSIAALVIYAATGIMGWEFFSPARKMMTPAERAAGARSFHFWSTGYRGGK